MIPTSRAFQLDSQATESWEFQDFMLTTRTVSGFFGKLPMLSVEKKSFFAGTTSPTPEVYRTALNPGGNLNISALKIVQVFQENGVYTMPHAINDDHRTWNAAMTVSNPAFAAEHLLDWDTKCTYIQFI